MIKSMELENFKAFKNSGEVNLNKINIFVGPNSSGKSSFIKALLTLKNTIDSNDEDMVLDLNERVGNFKSVVFKNQVSNQIKFKLNFENDEINGKNNSKLIVNEKIFKVLTLLSKMEPEKELKDHLIELNKINRTKYIDYIKFSIKITRSDRIVVDEFIINYSDNNITKVKMIGNSYYIFFNDQKIVQPNVIVPKKFIFEINEMKINRNLTVEELRNIALFEYSALNIIDKLGKFTEKISHIEPLRNRIKRVEYVTNIKFNNTVGKSGENTITTLVGLEKNLKEDSNISIITKQINRWLSEFDLGESISVKRLGNDNYSLFIKNKNTKTDCNIMDVGVGTSQLLPIIIESINSPEKSMLVIEEPESHIHPNAQSKLAELFVDVVNRQNKRFVIETHSIFLIVQLQILVAKGEIPADDISIYYFNQMENGTQIKNMKISENGQFEEPWPSGFFDVQVQLGKILFESI